VAHLLKKNKNQIKLNGTTREREKKEQMGADPFLLLPSISKQNPPTIISLPSTAGRRWSVFGQFYYRAASAVFSGLFLPVC
jgi:hypothetical protein